jgi:hypothetical protein
MRVAISHSGTPRSSIPLHVCPCPTMLCGNRSPPLRSSHAGCGEDHGPTRPPAFLLLSPLLPGATVGAPPPLPTIVATACAPPSLLHGRHPLLSSTAGAVVPSLSLLRERRSDAMWLATAASSQVPAEQRREELQCRPLLRRSGLHRRVSELPCGRLGSGGQSYCSASFRPPYACVGSGYCVLARH